MPALCLTNRWMLDEYFLLLFISLLSPVQSRIASTRNLDISELANQVSNFETPFAVCRSTPGLTRKQLDLCHRRPDVTLAALEGLRLAVQECQHQFRWNRWNCSSLATKNNNPRNTIFFQRGYRESAFAYAISAAGVAHSVARACSQGRLVSCGCDPASYRHQRRVTNNNNNPTGHWKWGGCSHNLHYGIDFSRKFLDSAIDSSGDIHSKMSVHNSEAGRLAVANNMQIRCKCHGMSGSCELKTCWKTSPEFRQVGRILKKRFRTALLVNQSNMGNAPPILLNSRIRDRKHQKPRDKPRPEISKRKRGKNKRDISSELLYYQKSPNFCELDSTLDIPGTAGRQCNKTSTGNDNCASLCCGRGYNMMRRRRTERCNCVFHWCCEVQCQNCTVEEWITICK